MDARGTPEITLEAMRMYYDDSDSIEKRLVMAFGRRDNPIVTFIEGRSDDDAAVIDELSDLDRDAGVAKLTA
ncbi:MAG: hypothetical protein KF819_11020 [Labilithrix sp.]|nr:hypothetical protein [Labilithrix sp.]